MSSPCQGRWPLLPHNSLATPMPQCKDNIWSDHGNTADIDYLNILGSKSFTPDNDPTLSDNPQNVWQVSDIGSPSLESLMMITARRSHTLPTPLYFITPAWSALDLVSISFSFIYFIYHAVNFILYSLSNVCSFQHLKPFSPLCPLFLMLLCCTPHTFLHLTSGPQVYRLSDTSSLRTAWLFYDLWLLYDPVHNTALPSVTSGDFHRTRFAVLRKMYLSMYRTLWKTSFWTVILLLWSSISLPFVVSFEPLAFVIMGPSNSWPRYWTLSDPIPDTLGNVYSYSLNLLH